MKDMVKLSHTYDAKYDFLKFFLSLFVVAIHSQLYPHVLFPWLRIAVPLFFITSSYFIFSKLKTVSFDEQTAVLKKFVVRNLKLYCFWFVVLLPITLYIRYDDYFLNGAASGVVSFLRSLLFGSTFAASWYIMASIIGVILIYFLSKKLKQWVVAIVALSAFCIVSLWSSYKSVFEDIGVVYRFVEGYESIFGNPILSFPTSLVWIFVGKCFAENKIKLPSLWISISVFVVTCCGLLLEWHFVRQLNDTVNNDSYFLLLPACISFFGCIQKIKPISCKYARYFRHASTLIYALHASLMRVVRVLCGRVLHNSSALLIFAVTLISCLLIYAYIEYVIYRFPDKKFAQLLKNAY